MIQPRNYLMGQEQDLSNIALYGQENNRRTWTICKLNMFLHGVMSANIEHLRPVLRYGYSGSTVDYQQTETGTEKRQSAVY